MNKIKKAFLSGMILILAACTPAPVSKTHLEPEAPMEATAQPTTTTIWEILPQTTPTAGEILLQNTLTGSILFISEQGRISLMDLASPNSYVDLTGSLGVFSATWSPDGARLAYVTFQQPTADPSAANSDPSLLSTDVLAIWAIDSEGRNAVQLSSSAPGERWQQGFAWSPDGKWIAAVKLQWLTVTTSTDQTSGSISLGPSTLNLIRTDGSGEIRPMGTTRYGTAVQWLPDGEHIVLLISDNELDVIDLDGNVESRIPVKILDEQGTGFAVSATANQLAYFVEDQQGYNLMLRPLDTLLQGRLGDPSVLVEGLFNAQTEYVPMVGSLVWSPDGRYLMYVSIVDSVVRLHLVRADGGAAVIVTEYGECLEPVDQPVLCWPYSMRPGFSPDSEWIVYNVGRTGYQAPPKHGLYLVNVEDALRGHPTPITLPLPGYEPLWKP